MKIKIALIVFILFATTVVAEVKGQFKAGTTVVAAKADCAYLVRGQYDGRKTQVEIVLSEKAVDPKAAVAELSPHNQMINQPEILEANYILLWVDTDGKVSMNAKAGGVQYLNSTEESLKAEFQTNTLDHVAGHVYTPKPVKPMGGPEYQLDFTFDTVVTKAPVGKPLPAGGGEAGTALMSLQKAMSKDLPALNSLLTEETISRLQHDYSSADENFKDTVDILTAWLPKKNWKVVHGELIDENTAVLEVEGDMFEGTQAVYIARMKKSPSGWKFDQATVVGMIK